VCDFLSRSRQIDFLFAAKGIVNELIPLLRDLQEITKDLSNRGLFFFLVVIERQIFTAKQYIYFYYKTLKHEKTSNPFHFFLLVQINAYGATVDTCKCQVWP
jgi:hypothetical protein